MTKQDFFKKILAGCYSSRNLDPILLTGMYAIGWRHSRRGLMCRHISMRSSEDYREGGAEWREDIMKNLKKLGQI